MIQATSSKCFKTVLLLLLFNAPCILKAQSGASNVDNFQKMTDVLPPSPNAAAMTKYGGIGLSKNTGAPNISIPLYTIKGKTISLPVTLNYSSSGIKVDEIASRAGMGWTLNAGGVITRTVRGWADETHTRHIPWWTTVGDLWETFKFMKDLSDAWFYSGMDGEADLFSFNFPGGSGNFVFDHLNNIVQQTYSNQKIEYNFSSTDWNFRITDANGIQYEFGGTGRTEKTKRTSNCAKSFDDFITTAWFLKRIVHPSGEEISFDYSSVNYTHETGLSQTLVYTYDSPLGNALCTPCTNNPSAVLRDNCVNKVSTQGVKLDQINCTSTYQRVSFGYTGRDDCSDVLVSSITLTNTLDVVTMGSFSLVYTTEEPDEEIPYDGESASGIGINKTPYLTSLVEAGATGGGATPKTHYFQYLDAHKRSQRLSFAQDHWGYFNGKQNDILLTKSTITDLGLASKFPQATADREPDGKFTARGMLCGIVYPTGGKDSIIYEPNQSIINNAHVRLPHKLECSVTDPTTNGTGVTEKTSGFFIGAAQNVELIVNVSQPGGPHPNDYGHLYIYNSAGTQIWDELFVPDGANEVRHIPLQGSNTGTTYYKIKLVSRGITTAVTTSIELEYISFNPQTGTSISTTGGVRVRSVLTSNENNVPMVKRYFYGQLSSLETSSSSWPQKKEYLKTYDNRTYCSINGSATTNYCRSTALYSGTLYGLYDYQSSPVSYTSVVESIGENFEGGGTQSKFKAVSDQKGQMLWGNELLDAPVSSFSNYGNGMLLEEIQLKKNGSGQLIPVTKKVYNPILDNRGFKAVKSFIVNKKYDFGPFQPTTDSMCVKDINHSNHQNCVGTIEGNMECFDMMSYDFPSYWIYSDVDKEYVYDANGQNPVLTQTTNYYENATYQQLTKTEALNSKNELITTIYKYPNDFSANSVLTEMAAKNIISPLIEMQVKNGNDQVSKTVNNYEKNTTANNYLINNIHRAEGSNSLESIGQVTVYDAKSNICEYTGRDGITNCIIWGYNYMYPVAKVVGATYSSAVSQLTNGVSGLQSLDGTSLLSELNNIRTGLSDALVTTYTYKHMGGVKTITDPNNRTTTYTYDGFNRLLEVVDKDGNVVKKNEYVYSSTQLEKMGLYVNTAQTANFNVNACNSGYQGSQVSYTIPAGTYYSVVSVSDANTKAQAALQTAGQAYANRVGNCILQTSNCTGEGYAIIGCGCEFGQKICSTAVETSPGVWELNYKYRWSDGSESANINVQNIACSGVEYKMINCTCRRGIKMYISSELIVNEPGSPFWRCGYKYHWPDGTSSSTTYYEDGPSPCQLSIQ